MSKIWILILGCALGACHARQVGDADRVTIVVNMEGATQCSYSVNGQNKNLMDDRTLRTIFEPMQRNQSLIFRSEQQVPYRCVGGILYTLQTMGFTQISVVEP